MPTLPRRGSKAFTLLELIVVIVILGILAAIAIPSFQKVIVKSQDSSAEQTLEAIDREAHALAAFRGESTPTSDDYAEATSDLPPVAADLGTYAARGWKLKVPAATPTTGTYEHVETYTTSSSVLQRGEVHLGYDAAGTVSGLATVSESGNCVLLQSKGSGAETFTRGDLGANCTGGLAVQGPTASTPAYSSGVVAPGAPAAVTAVAGDTQATVTWSAPASDGGATITAYTVTAAPGGAAQTWTTGPLTATFTGLTNGTAYTFTVTATNSNGTGAGTTSSAVTPRAPLTQTYTAAGSYSFTVPSDVTQVTIQARGARNGLTQEQIGQGYKSGSSGALARGTFTVTPGETLSVYVGGDGATNRTGGWNGGGHGGLSSTSSTYNGVGGGGASDVRRGGTALTNRIIVGSGAGGAGSEGGTTAGYSLGGTNGCFPVVHPSQTSGGKAQTVTDAGCPNVGSDGAFGQAGNGGSGSSKPGHGGGGGWYGGAGSNGGTTAGFASSGSSYVHPDATNPSMTGGTFLSATTATPAAQVTITY